VPEPDLLRILPEGPAETGRPPAGRVLAGDPVFTTWNHEARAGLWCGVWECTPGRWRVAYDEWEYCRILSGVSVVTRDGSPPVTLRAGDSLVIRPGFAGVWEVVETTRKDYVILEPAPPPG
jgi:uncharacterized cupin superfamily protein